MPVQRFKPSFRSGRAPNRYRSARRSIPRGVSTTLPQLQINVATRHVFRFVCVSASGADTAITDAFLSRLLLATVSGSTNATELIAGFKIERIQIWFPVSGSQPLSAINLGPAITWLGGGLGADKTITCHSLSTAVPPHIDTRPPKLSQASFWGLGAGNSNTYFSINNAVEGSYFDLTLSIKMQIGAATVTTIAVASFTGLMYGRLDGSAGIWSNITGGITAAE